MKFRNTFNNEFIKMFIDIDLLKLFYDINQFIFVIQRNIVKKNKQNLYKNYIYSMSKKSTL